MVNKLENYIYAVPDELPSKISEWDYFKDGFDKYCQNHVPLKSIRVMDSIQKEIFNKAIQSLKRLKPDYVIAADLNHDEFFNVPFVHRSEDGRVYNFNLKFIKQLNTDDGSSVYELRDTLENDNSVSDDVFREKFRFATRVIFFVVSSHDSVEYLSNGYYSPYVLYLSDSERRDKNFQTNQKAKQTIAIEEEFKDPNNKSIIMEKDPIRKLLTQPL